MAKQDKSIDFPVTKAKLELLFGHWSLVIGHWSFVQSPIVDERVG
ncbi:hypothetical protein NIES22_48070 [Calothrix brevissima NIES-22]|nr:hypothetical protein NIES22_48070 [Calothrix brevissima NIES-22]